jgi:hypothetical protein
MDTWRCRLAFQTQNLLDDEDERMILALKVLIDNLGIEDEIPERRTSGDSKLGKRPNVYIKHQAWHERIFSDYFAGYLVYTLEVFQRCY